MKYRNYKEIRQLYTQEGTDEKLFDHIIKIYPAIQKIDFEKTEAVLFTRSLDDFVVDDKKYIERIENYIQRSYKNILLKKHPREQSVYQFENGIKCLEVDNSVDRSSTAVFKRKRYYTDYYKRYYVVYESISVNMQSDIVGWNVRRKYEEWDKISLTL